MNIEAELVARIRTAFTQALPCCTEGSLTREAVIEYLVTGKVTTYALLEGGGVMGTPHRVHREASSGGIGFIVCCNSFFEILQPGFAERWIKAG